tara:strand:- start:28654 stop:33966 length:5313 start_codon:yes stop_codon:yes gene_type:complete
MAKEFLDNKTLEVYQQGGDTVNVNSCPEATSDNILNVDNRERSIARSNYGKANTESKCGNCMFYDISNRMKKCADTKSDNIGYCWSQEFVCGTENVCDMWEEGGPIKSNKDSYAQDESYDEFEQNKAEVEQIQNQQQMPVLNESQQQPMAQQQSAPPQSMPPQQQAPMPQEQMQPSYAYGGSLRKAQESLEIDYTIDPATGKPFDKTPIESIEDRDIRLEKERIERERIAGLDNNTDIYDANNPAEAGATLKSKYKNWRTKRAIKKYQKSLTPEDPFMMYNSDPSQGAIGEIGNWLKSVKKDFTTNWDHDNKKSNYQKYTITNPYDDVRFYDKDNPDSPLLNYGQYNSQSYNKFSNTRRESYPELYQESSMDLDGNITYKGDKLLGDMVETEYMPDAVQIQHTEDGTGITGAYVFTGVNDNGEKDYQFVPFDKENPTQISVGPSKQKRAEEQMRDKNECINAGGEWADGVCTYPEDTTINPTNQQTQNDNFEGDLNDLEFDPDQQFGGTPTFAYMRDGGDLTKFQSKSQWSDEQLETYLKLQEDMLTSGGVDPNKIDPTIKSTWPNVKHSIADGTYNSMLPWLPDMSTEKGRSEMYNLHRTASEKFPKLASMPALYWGTDKDGNSYPYANESVSEKGFKEGTLMNDHLTNFNKKIKNVKNKTELKTLMTEFNDKIGSEGMMYIINQANQNNNIDISNKDFVDVLKDVETFRLDNAELYDENTYGPGDIVKNSNINEYGKVTLNEDYQYNPHTYKPFKMENPDKKWNQGDSAPTKNGSHGPAWNEFLWNMDNFFEDKNIYTNKKGEKLTRPTEVWDPNANNGEGAYIAIGETFTNKTNTGDLNEKKYVINILTEKGIIPEGATNEEKEKIAANFTGGFGSKIGNYMDDAFNKTIPSEYNEEALTNFTNTFSNPTFQQYSNSDPNQIVKSKAEALNSMKLNSNMYGAGNLPSEIYGNKTGLYNPYMEGSYYVDQTTGENVWVANPEYDSKFAVSARGDVKNGFDKNYASFGDYITDAPISTTLGKVMQNKDVKFALDNPGYTFGPLAMEAGPLLNAAGALANYTKVAPLMNTGLLGTNVSSMNALNAGIGIDMGMSVPGNIAEENYGMAGVNSLFGLGTAVSAANKFNRTANLYPNLGKPSLANGTPVNIINPTAAQKSFNFNNQLRNYTTNMRTLPFNKQVGPFIKDFKTIRNSLKQPVAPIYNPTLIRQYGGSLYKAQNGAQDVAAQYQVNPEQFDYDTNMPKEGAISAYGDVWQGGEWVDATVEEQGFNTPDSDQFGMVQNAFSDETGVTNRNANYDPDRAYPFSANAINQDIKSAAAKSFDVRRSDIDMNTYKPEDGSVNKSYGDVFSSEDNQFNDNQFTPQYDQTDNFAFEGDNNTLSRGQLRDVRKSNRRQNRAEEKGYGSYDEMKIGQKQKRQDKRKRWGDTLGVQARNVGNYLLDSDLGQAFQKGSKAIKEGLGSANKFIDELNANKEQERLLTTRSAGQMYGVTSADTMSRGEHDENSGIFQVDDKVISRQGKYGTELPRAQYGHTGWGQTNPRMGLKYNSGDNPLSLFVGADLMNCWGGSCKDDGGGKFKRGFYSELSPYKTTKTPQTITPDGEVIDGESYEQWTASGDAGGRLRFDQDFYGLPVGGPSGIMLEGSGGMKFGEEGIDPYYGGRVGMQFKAPRGLKLPQWNYRSKDRADFMPQSQVDIYADWKNNEGLKIGADARWGVLNAGVTYNPSTSSWDYSAGLGTFFKSGGEKKEETINVNSDMYYELIAAGADLEII